MKFCRENEIYISVIPGASSITSALQISSIPINRYTFEGFLPKSKKNINEFINQLRNADHTSVFFVSSHKILTLLEVLTKEIINRKIAICKEITKINENVFLGFPRDVLKAFKENKKNSLGEFVVVVEGDAKTKKPGDGIDIETIDIIRKLLNKFSLTDTVEIVHKIGNIGKKELYKKTLTIKNEK